MSQAPARLDLEAPTRATAGEPVALVLRLRNPTADSQTVYLRGREITFDLVVTDSAGRPVWRRLEGAVIPAMLQVRTLAPGEVVVLATAWSGRDQDGAPVPAGRYELRASLLTDAAPITSPPARIVVAAPPGRRR